MSSTTYSTQRPSTVAANPNNWVFPDFYPMIGRYPSNSTTFNQQYQALYPPIEQTFDNAWYGPNENLRAFFAAQRPMIHSLPPRPPSTAVTAWDQRGDALGENLDSLTLAPQEVARDFPNALPQQSVQVPYPIHPSFGFNMNTIQDPFPSGQQFLAETAAPAPEPFFNFIDEPFLDSSSYERNTVHTALHEASGHQEALTLPSQEAEAEENNRPPSSSSYHDAGQTSAAGPQRRKTPHAAPKPYSSRRRGGRVNSQCFIGPLPTYLVADTIEQDGLRFIIPCLQPDCNTPCIGAEELVAHLWAEHRISGSKSGKNAQERVPCLWAGYQSSDGLVARREHLREIHKLLNISFRCRGHNVKGSPCGKTYARMDTMLHHWARAHGNRAGALWDEVYRKEPF